MSAERLTSGGKIDRGQQLSFTFDGMSYSGFKGDTLASALLANGVRIVGRSFKYHRPRGVWGAWVDDPNAIFNVRLGGYEFPNCAGATTYLVDGMELKAVNAWPSARFDVKGGLDLFHRWLGAGFYYKTFMWPDWHLFEPMIRKMAGLGRLEPGLSEAYRSDQSHDQCELLVIGGGAAGLAAARAACEAGHNVVLVDDHAEMGGALYRVGGVEGTDAADWVAAQVNAINLAGGRILTETTAFGVFDHKLVGLVQNRTFGEAPKLIRMRAGRVLLATGALDRPLTFANNDLPGIMSLDAADEFLGRYGVLVGRKIVILRNGRGEDGIVDRLKVAGADVADLAVGEGNLSAYGRKAVRGVIMDGNMIEADAVLVSGGRTPLVHLWCHAGGKLSWDDYSSAFVPAIAPDGFAAIGAANGTFDIDDTLAEARARALGQSVTKAARRDPAHPPRLMTGWRGRQWIDFQHDVTLKDVELSARENYASVEHLKRYTTLGMASDQGKTSNMAGLAAMAQLTGRTIPEVGTTTFRPPFVPLPIETYHGHHRGQLFHPLKRLALEAEHRAAGAALCEYGGWLRPGWYGTGDPDDRAQDEARMARRSVGILDASPLGKIEVMGPDAEAFMNFIYYNTMATLAPGNIRYGFMLTEQGVVYDDGVVARMGDNRFIVSCSSSHVDGVSRMLEIWRQDGNDPDRLFIHDTTQNWTTLTLTGPKARVVAKGLELPLDLSPEVFPHMAIRECDMDGNPLRVARVSFTGDVSIEISVRPSRAVALWNRMCDLAREVGGGPIGIEALSILRAEKGFIIVGKDTDGETMPHDLGFAAPRMRKKTEYVGDRGLHSEAANDPDRRQLVGLAVPAGANRLTTGAHIVSEPVNPKSEGIVTSSYFSPTLDRPIALALLARGSERHGQTVTIWHMGQSCMATVCAPCAFDSKGDRLHA